MKVLLIGPAPPIRGGISAHTRGLAAALSAAGHVVEVVSYLRQYPGFLFPGTAPLQGGESLGAARLDVLDPRTWRALAGHVNRSGVDVVVVQWWHPVTAPALWTVLRGRGKARVIVLCHNLTPHEWFPASRFAAKRCLQSADLLICHSAAIRRRVAELLPGRLAVSLPMPLLTEPGFPSRLEARRRLGLPAQLKLAGFVGHWRAYKGIDYLLEAWRHATLPEGAGLLLAGESYLGHRKLAKVLAAARRDPSIYVQNKYLSEIELKCCVAACEVLVLPYLSASQSGVAPLAVAAGVPLIVSDAGGLNELAGFAGTRVVPPASIEALAAAISLALAGPQSGVERPAMADSGGAWPRLVEVIEGCSRRLQ